MIVCVDLHFVTTVMAEGEIYPRQNPPKHTKCFFFVRDWPDANSRCPRTRQFARASFSLAVVFPDICANQGSVQGLMGALAVSKEYTPSTVVVFNPEPPVPDGYWDDPQELFPIKNWH